MTYLWIAPQREVAVVNTKVKRKEKAKGVDTLGKRITQTDVQKKVISFHFTDAHLTNIHLWYLLRKLGPNVSVRPNGAINSDFRWGESLSSRFFASRDRLNFGDTHEELLRGDDVRSIGQTWAHKNCVVVEREDIGLPNFPMFLTIKDADKTVQLYLHPKDF